MDLGQRTKEIGFKRKCLHFRWGMRKKKITGLIFPKDTGFNCVLGVLIAQQERIVGLAQNASDTDTQRSVKTRYGRHIMAPQTTTGQSAESLHCDTMACTVGERGYSLGCSVPAPEVIPGKVQGSACTSVSWAQTRPETATVQGPNSPMVKPHPEVRGLRLWDTQRGWESARTLTATAYPVEVSRAPAIVVMLTTANQFSAEYLSSHNLPTDRSQVELTHTISGPFICNELHWLLTATGC
jgi:hypothetical protein